MTDNWLLLVILIGFLIGLIVGVFRGAIKIAVSLLATAATFALVFYATPYVNKTVTNMTPIRAIIQDQIEETVKHMWDKDVVETSDDSEDVPKDVQISAIEKAQLPEVFKSLLISNNNAAIYEDLGVDSFVGYVASFLASLILNIISFLLTFIVITIVLRAVLFSLNVIEDLPALGIFNRIAGGFLGMAGVLIIVWVAFVLITLLYALGVGKGVFDLIQNDDILSFIYDLNPVMKLATTIR